MNSKKPNKKLVEGFVRNLGTIVKRILRRPIPPSPTNRLSPTPYPSNIDGIGFLKRPRQRVKCEAEAEPVFVFSKRNYKVYANI